MKPIAILAAATLALVFATPAAAVMTDYQLFGTVDTVLNPAGLGDIVVGQTYIEAYARVDPALRFDVTAAANAAFGAHYTRLEAAPVGPLGDFVLYFVVLTAPPPIVIGFERPDWITTPDPLGVSGPYVLFDNGRFSGMGFAAINPSGMAVFSSGAAPYAFDFVGGDIRLGGPSFGGHFLAQSVPEPGSWALLLVGFGLAGAALRRRRTQVMRRRI